MKTDHTHTLTVGMAAAFICVILAAIMGWQLSSQHVQYDKQADYYAAEFAAKSDQEVMQSCSLTTGLYLVKCLRDELEAERDTKRSEADLAAQQKVAKWSLGVFVVSALSTGFTLAGLWFVLLNLREARKITAQSAHANSQAARAALAAHHSADEARFANKIASEAAERQLRAYVVLDSIEVEEMILNPSDIDILVFVNWKNAGQTPTRGLRWDINFCSFEDDIPNAFEFPNSSASPDFSSIGPGQISKDVSYFISSNEYESARLGFSNLYVWGWVEYSDAFVNTPRRRTEFCVRLDINNGPDGKGQVFRPHTVTKHNASDDDCLKKPTAVA